MIQKQTNVRFTKLGMSTKCKASGSCDPLRMAGRISFGTSPMELISKVSA